MDLSVSKWDVWFFVICLGLGVLAEQMFFHGEIGVAYIIFILAFYTVVFIRFRKMTFKNRRMGLLLMGCIWFLALHFFLYSNPILYGLDILIIPCLVMAHLVLLTSKTKQLWYQFGFVRLIFIKIKRMVSYDIRFLGSLGGMLGKGMDTKKIHIMKRILIGLIISLPLLFIVGLLLVSADLKFAQLLNKFPHWIYNLKFQENTIRCFVILLYTFGFFGFLQGLNQKEKTGEGKGLVTSLDSVIALTILFVLNGVYTLFTIVQFTYFFSGSLQGDLTYAEYARQGFAQLILVTIINLTLIVVMTTFMEKQSHVMSIVNKIMLTLMVGFSAVMLLSAYLRLEMYEEAYGFTIFRILAHTFMIYLMMTFIYTLIKIWVVKLSLRHFFIISALVYYTLLNTVNIDQMIVNQNIKRYEQTGKIDLYYLNNLSYTGVIGLIHLYEKYPNMSHLHSILVTRYNTLNNDTTNWRSFNVSKEKAYKDLRNVLGGK